MNLEEFSTESLEIALVIIEALEKRESHSLAASGGDHSSNTEV